MAFELNMKKRLQIITLFMILSCHTQVGLSMLLPSFSSLSSTDSADSVEQLKDSLCGLNPLDIFLTALYAEIDRRQPISADPDAPPTIPDKFYAFTVLPDHSPVHYQKLMHALNRWNHCKARFLKRPTTKKFLL
ncbi:hypothetical protein EG68_02770 [Paragonimus skrjabini miyazakii]|uniref:Uncharacterized protein n=1 Tax=Paragonimus skrjabini miyazakii TaxID=59628 RepID=A0A8S9Z035_9TREM|nr:hypothetical protein EG68_02770 [Paragonimus skrjabini miyazakii]